MKTMVLALLAAACGTCAAYAAPLATVDRYGSYVSVEPYAPNIVHVTIAADRGEADKAAGDGLIAPADAAGWSRSIDASGDVFASSALTAMPGGGTTRAMRS